ncbi:MAG: circularly permuted type 2 ATP-grasp protein [Candidatus Omnitrophica bacterium]|nr:circularly permuted type 2 ATP-grasp protein [Candidatus Omnitrophota bacterium]
MNLKIFPLASAALLSSLLPCLAFSGESQLEIAIAEKGKIAKENADLYYDEVFDRSGNIRPQYRDIYPVYLQKTKEELDAIRKATTKDFRGDNALSPLPRIMPEREFGELKAGVEQRGKALLLFLQDHYSGKKTYLDKVIPREVIQRIVDRAGEGDFEGKIRPELIRFMYGPDIIRDAGGVNRVLEDNTSFLGGQGDLVIAKESLFKHMPQLKEVLEKEPLVDPRIFYKDLLARYRSEMKNPAEKVVVFAIPPYSDKEDYRLRKIWQELGVEWVTPNGPKRLIKKADGLYLQVQEGKRSRLEKVGYVVFNTEFYAADPTFPANKKQLLLKEATEQLSLKGKNAIPESVKKGLDRAIAPDPKTGKIDFQKIENILKMNSSFAFNPQKGTVPGILEAITSGQVLSNNTPGTEFMNDKEFNIYVEDIIRHYLKEEPILKNLPAERLYKVDRNGRRVVNEEVFRKLENNWDKYVVKTVDGRGGDGVWVGPKLSREERASLVQRLRKDVGRETIIQAYSHPSVLGNDIVDLRILSQVGYGGKGAQKLVYVPDIGWSRGVSMQGDGKVNLSAGTAHEVAVLVRKEPVAEGESALPAASNCPTLYHHWKP